MEAKKMKEKILNWFATGEVSASSKAMASCIAGVNGGNSHPYDPSDLNRCLLFLEAVPENLHSLRDAIDAAMAMPANAEVTGAPHEKLGDSNGD